MNNFYTELLLDFENKLFKQQKIIDRALKQESGSKFEEKIFPGNSVNDFIWIWPDEFRNLKDQKILVSFDQLFRHWQKQKNILWINILIWTDIEYLELGKKDQHYIRVILFKKDRNDSITNAHELASKFSNTYINKTLSLSYLLYPQDLPKGTGNKTKPNILFAPHGDNIPYYLQQSPSLVMCNTSKAFKKITLDLETTSQIIKGEKELKSYPAQKEAKQILNKFIKNPSVRKIKRFALYLAWLKNLYHKSFYYYVFPTQLSHNEAIAGIHVGTLKPLSITEFGFFNLVSNTFGKFLQLSVQNLRKNRFVEENKSKALQAIIAEIMNRNYAHHIGSHISLRSTFNKILLRLGRKIESISPSETATIAQMIKKLNQYKDERNEFIAALNNKPIFQSSNFYQEVILPLLENILFMDNIAKNEGICYINKTSRTENDEIDGENSECRLKIKVYFQKQDENKTEEVTANYYKNGINTFCSLEIPYFKKVNKIDDTFHDDKKIKNDFKVSLPGSLGKHCIYSILENFIRNTAKHSYDKAIHLTRNIDIILTIIENKEHYDVELTDNISDGSKWESLKAKIETSILERKHLGISDMKINACLLAGEKLSDENMKKSLEVFQNEKKHIAYRFKLIKPKEIALIGGNWKEALKSDGDGIYYYKNLNDYIKNCEIKNFRFCIINSNTSIEDITKNHNQLPFRVIILDDNHKVNASSLHMKNFVFVKSQIFNDCIDTQNLMSLCWDLWLHSFGESDIELIAFFEQQINQKDSPTKDWNDFINSNRNKLCKIINPQVWYYDNEKNLVQRNVKLNKEGSLYILYDRHAKMAERLEVSLLERNFYEPIDKNNLDFNTIFNIKGDKLNENYIYELAEAGLLRVLIIDERAAEASTELIPDERHYYQINKRGFGQYANGFNKEGVLKFDACWAAKIFIATHLCYDESNKYECLNKEIADNKYHILKIKFHEDENTNKILIDAKTNFMQWNENVTWSNNIWQKKGETLGKIESNDPSNFDIDLLIIHRTILKKILEKERWKDFIKKLDVSRILIITGGGVVDFVSNDERLKIISTDILRNYIIGNRPAKYNLVNILTS